MRELLNRTKLLISQLNERRILYITLVVVGFFLITAASQNLYSIRREDSVARSEYDELRELFYMMNAYSSDDISSLDAESPVAEQAEPQAPGHSLTTPDSPVDIPADPFECLAWMNPDFVGWISISDTVVDYPVVQGRDNECYLSTTFNGSRNPAGAIFMDYRCARGFYEPICVLYGHNMRDGSMFAELNNYIEPAFMAEHPDINIKTKEGDDLIYRVFDAMYSDMRDTTPDVDVMEAYAAEAAIGSASRFLILSTCTPGADKDERILVYSVLVG